MIKRVRGFCGMRGTMLCVSGGKRLNKFAGSLVKGEHKIFHNVTRRQMRTLNFLSLLGDSPGCERQPDCFVFCQNDPSLLFEYLSIKWAITWSMH